MLPGQVDVSLNKSKINAIEKPSVLRKEERGTFALDDKITSRKDPGIVEVVKRATNLILWQR